MDIIYQIGLIDNDKKLEECGSIYPMYVLEEYWGKGLAMELMNLVLIILKAKGCKQASLWGYEANVRARRFY